MVVVAMAGDDNGDSDPPSATTITTPPHLCSEPALLLNPNPDEHTLQTFASPESAGRRQPYTRTEGRDSILLRIRRQCGHQQFILGRPTHTCISLHRRAALAGLRGWCGIVHAPRWFLLVFFVSCLYGTRTGVCRWVGGSGSWTACVRAACPWAGA